MSGRHRIFDKRKHPSAEQGDCLFLDSWFMHHGVLLHKYPEHPGADVEFFVDSISGRLTALPT